MKSLRALGRKAIGAQDSGGTDEDILEALDAATAAAPVPPRAPMRPPLDARPKSAHANLHSGIASYLPASFAQHTQALSSSAMTTSTAPPNKNFPTPKQQTIDELLEEEEALGSAPGDMLGFHVGNRSFAVYHAADDGLWYATAGKCTHGAGVLADGLVVEGTLVECPKHNGCFDFKTGLPKRLPVKSRLATFETKVEGETVFVKLGGTKHVEIRYHYVRDQVLAGKLRVAKVGTDDNVADILTKAIKIEAFVRHRDALLSNQQPE